MTIDQLPPGQVPSGQLPSRGALSAVEKSAADTSAVELSFGAPAGQGPVRVATVLDRLVKSFGAPSSTAIELVFSDWESLVGPQMAGHVRPLGVEDDCLVLAVADPAWASQVRWLGPELVSRLARRDPQWGIERVEIRVVPESS